MCFGVFLALHILFFITNPEKKFKRGTEVFVHQIQSFDNPEVLIAFFCLGQICLLTLICTFPSFILSLLLIPVSINGYSEILASSEHMDFLLCKVPVLALDVKVFTLYINLLPVTHFVKRITCKQPFLLL